MGRGLEQTLLPRRHTNSQTPLKTCYNVTEVPEVNFPRHQNYIDTTPPYLQIIMGHKKVQYKSLVKEMIS